MFKTRVTEGQDVMTGLRMIVAALALVPILISKNPVIDTVSISIVVGLVGWNIVAVLRLRRSKAVMNTYTIIIDGGLSKS